VAGISRRVVAQRSGVDLDDVDRFVELGLLVPDENDAFTEGDVRRARTYRGLERAGLPTDVMIEAIARGELSFDWLDLPVYDRYAALSPSSFRAVSEREGIPLDLLLVVREAIGFAQADPDDLMREDELRLLPILKLQVSRGFDPAVTERWLRVIGDALRRVTETEADWWHTQVVLPALASGLNTAEAMATTNRWGDEISSLMEEALLVVYRANQEHAWTENMIEEVDDALDRAGLRKRMESSPAICFLDLTGYTRLTEEQGDQAAAEVVTRLTSVVERSAGRHGGKVVKRLGDGVMLHFRDPTTAVRSSLEMLETVGDAGLPEAHIGLDTGPVVFQGGDYFGRTVNLAARIAEQARPGQILVSDEVAASVDDGAFALTAIGRVELKGVARPVRLHAVERRA
jgi:adenylate cyclase